MLAKLEIPNLTQVPSVVLQLLQACSQENKAEIVALFCNIHCLRSKIEVKEINIEVLHHHFFVVCAQKTEGDVRTKKNVKFPDIRYFSS
jgi:hypothetical protein